MTSDWTRVWHNRGWWSWQGVDARKLFGIRVSKERKKLYRVELRNSWGNWTSGFDIDEDELRRFCKGALELIDGS